MLVLVALSVGFSACGNKDNENAERFKDAAMNLDKSTNILDDEYDYWPNCGMRITGSHLASLISLNELEEMLPCPLYVSGPHHDGQWDLYNEESFGHYNPEAIKYLSKLASKVVSDKNFVRMSKPLVDEYLSSKLKCIVVTYDVLHADELPGYMAYFEVTADQLRELLFSEALEFNGGYWYQTAGMAEFLEVLSIEEDIYDYGLGAQMLYFWARRWSDGTMDEFYKAFSTVYKAYHPEYQFSAGEYLRVVDWDEVEFDLDYDGEYTPTNYDWELEEDEPVSDNERINEKDAVEMIRTAVSNLDNTTLVLEDEFDYWPECGIRVTGGHLFSLISLRMLNRMLPCDLYVNGPHHYNRWELNDPVNHGSYNPEAVAYLNQLATKVVADKKFVKKTQPLVDKYLKRQMFIMKGLYDGLNDESVCSDKQAVLDNIYVYHGHANGTPAGGFLYELMDELEDDSFVYSNTGEMFLYWWARRDVDGTMEQFHDILETVYSAYYPE